MIQESVESEQNLYKCRRRAPSAKPLSLLVCWMLLGGLTACQERYYWTKSGASTQQTDLDHAGCRNLAARQSAREYDRELTILETTGGSDGSQLPRTFAKLDAAKREKKLFEMCLGRRGYQAKPVK